MQIPVLLVFKECLAACRHEAGNAGHSIRYIWFMHGYGSIFYVSLSFCSLVQSKALNFTSLHAPTPLQELFWKLLNFILSGLHILIWWNMCWLKNLLQKAIIIIVWMLAPLLEKYAFQTNFYLFSETNSVMLLEVLLIYIFWFKAKTQDSEGWFILPANHSF